MGDSAMTIIAIFLAAILMFIFPLMSLSDRNDDISQMAVQVSTTEFVDNVRTIGMLKQEDYDAFVQEISATGNAFDVDIEIKRMDENPSKKLAQASSTKIGENVYYSVYTSQIEEELTMGGVVKLNEGDYITVTVKNTNQTMSQMFKNFFYSLGGSSTSPIIAQHSGVVTSTGN